MADERWRPLWARDPGKAEEYDALVEGVPPWVTRGLTEWLNEYFLTWYSSERREPLPNEKALRDVEVRVRIPLDWKYGASSAHPDLLQKCVAGGEKFLSVVDFALSQIAHKGDGNDHDAAFALETLLRDAGSAWMVGPTGRSLARRVQPVAVEAARQVMAGGSRAGHYLGEAWHYTYGRNPHPGTAYREAVRAVEAAARPVISPKNPKATLGTIINELRDARPGKFATAFEGNGPGVNALDAVRALMGLVWTNQLDRHGTDDDEVPLHVSPEQAEAAVHAAVALVQWFERGVVRQAEP